MPSSVRQRWYTKTKSTCHLPSVWSIENVWGVLSCCFSSLKLLFKLMDGVFNVVKLFEWPLPRFPLLENNSKLIYIKSKKFEVIVHSEFMNNFILLSNCWHINRSRNIHYLASVKISTWSNNRYRQTVCCLRFELLTKNQVWTLHSRCKQSKNSFNWRESSNL